LTTIVSNLVAIARSDHGFENVFMLSGGALALVFAGDPFPGPIGWLLLGLVSTCLITMALIRTTGFFGAVLPPGPPPRSRGVGGTRRGRYASKLDHA
jgi:hypothetical protein